MGNKLKTLKARVQRLHFCRNNGKACHNHLQYTHQHPQKLVFQTVKTPICHFGVAVHAWETALCLKSV